TGLGNRPRTLEPHAGAVPRRGQYSEPTAGVGGATATMGHSNVCLTALLAPPNVLPSGRREHGAGRLRCPCWRRRAARPSMPLPSFGGPPPHRRPSSPRRPALAARACSPRCLPLPAADLAVA